MVSLQSQIRLLLAAGAALAVSVSGNEVRNPSFEEVVNGRPSIWHLGSWSPRNAPHGDCGVVKTNKRSGEYSLRFASHHDFSLVFARQPAIPVQPGEKIRISFQALRRSDSSSGDLAVQFLVRDGDGKPLTVNPEINPAFFDTWNDRRFRRTTLDQAAFENSRSGSSFDLGGATRHWENVSFDLTMPAGAGSGELIVYFVGKGEVFLDDISVERNPADTLPVRTPGLGESGRLSLQTDGNGKSVLRLLLHNTRPRPLRNLNFTARIGNTPVGSMAAAAPVAAGATEQFDIPVDLGSIRTPGFQTVVLEAVSADDPWQTPLLWVFDGDVMPEYVKQAVVRKQFGPCEPVPGTPDAMLLACTADNGKEILFAGPAGELPLRPDHDKLGFVLKLRNSSDKPAPVTLDWECLDFFWRGAKGKQQFMIPAKQDYLVSVELPEQQMRRLKQTLFESGAPYYRFSFTANRPGANPVKVETNLSYPRPKDFHKELPPLPETVVDLPAYGKCRLLDEVYCGDPKDPHISREGAKSLQAKYSSEPLGFYGGGKRLTYDWQKDWRETRDRFSRRETILGRECRVTDNCGWFTYELGRGAIVPGQVHVVEIEYPDDQPRAWYLNGLHTDLSTGFHTGGALGDSSTRIRFMQPSGIPNSGKYGVYRTIFIPTRKDIWINVATLSRAVHPYSKGAAVHAIRVYRLGPPSKLAELAPAVTLPEGLPHRRFGHLHEDVLINDVNANYYRFLGHNVIAPQALSYCGIGAVASISGNYGDVFYDSRMFSAEGARHPFVLRNPNYFKVSGSRFADNELRLRKKYGFELIPVLEYGGTARLPAAALAVDENAKPVAFRWGAVPDPKGGPRIAGSYRDTQALDMAHPAVGEDIGNLLIDLFDRTQPDSKHFPGVVLTSRFQAWQYGFGKETLDLFFRETGIVPPAGENPAKYVKNKLLDRFMAWHYRKKRENFLRAAKIFHGKYPGVTVYIQNYLGGDENLHFGNPLFLWDSTTVPDLFTPNRASVPDLAGVDLLAMMDDYRRHDVEQMSCGLNPRLYRDDSEVQLLAPVRYPFLTGNRKFLEAFRTKQGSAICLYRLYNEDAGNCDPMGSIAIPGLNSCEAAGPFSVYDELLTMATSDPHTLLIRIGTFYRGFPEYARTFVQAYLALPATLSELTPTATEGIVLRTYRTERGTYFALIDARRSFGPATVELDASELGVSKLRNLVTGAEILPEGGKFRVVSPHPSLHSFRGE